MTTLEKRRKPGVNQANNTKSGLNGAKKSTVTDARFKAVEHDPRFASMSKKDRKFKIDARFKPVLSDPRFKMVGDVDKYGRKIDVPENNKEMEDLYALEDDEPEADNTMQDEIIPEAPKAKSKKLKEKIDKKKELNKKKVANKDKALEMNGKKGKRPEINCFDEEGRFAWDVESSSSSDFDEISLGMNEQQIDEDLWESDNADIPQGDATKRLAMLNYDWENTKASDIMLFLSSFLPRSGFIKSVTVYPSEFGLERMKQEDTVGPQGIWLDEKDVEQEQTTNDFEIDANAPWIFKEEQNGDIDLSKLRKYEKDRLKYYYAVIECNSVATSKHIYDNCDGLEMELTSIKVDLRYVPDEQEFLNEPKEVCTEVPASATVNCFLNRAVQHTNVKLTWEEPKTNRFKELEGKLDVDDYDKVDLSRYIADSDSSIDSEDQEEELAKKRELLLGGGTTDWKDDFDKSKRRKNREEEMIIKFNPGFDVLGNKILEKTNPEKFKDEKKKAKKLKPKEDDEFFAEEEEVKMTEEERKRYEAELSLLVDEKGTRDKGKFKVDVNDPRFGGLYDYGDKYQIDPTSKHFDAKINRKTLEEQNKNRRKKVKPN